MSAQIRRRLAIVLFIKLCLAIGNDAMAESTGLVISSSLDFHSMKSHAVAPQRLRVDSKPSLFILDSLYVGDKDRYGLRRDTVYFMGMQLSILGLLYLAPESISGWSDEQVDAFGFGNWRDNVTELSWDKDRWWINCILHPYWGATYFTRARERNLNRREAFWYSVLLSSLYEFGGEAFFENPSVQDLIVTPVAGTFLGFWFEDLRNRIRTQGHPLSRGDKAILVLTDPLGAVGKQADRLLGVSQATTQFGLQPSADGGMLTIKLRW